MSTGWYLAVWFGWSLYCLLLLCIVWWPASKEGDHAPKEGDQ